MLPNHTVHSHILGGCGGDAVTDTHTAPESQMLRLSETQLLEAVVTNAPIVLFATDAQGVIRMSRGKALAALGLEQGQLVGESVFDLYVNEPAIADAARRCLGGEVTTSRLDLDSTIHETLFSPLYEGNTVVGIVGVASDITARALAETALRYQATHDVVTDLPNRSFFLQQLDEQLLEEEETNRPLTILVLLLDRFQEVSETFGYEVGMTVLRQTATRLREAALDGEVLSSLEAGKFGIMTSATLGEAHAVAKRFSDALSTGLLVDDREISISAHVGVATFPGHGKESEPLIRAAEQSARSAAILRHEFAIFEPRESDLKRNFMLLADLRTALAAGALRVEYQPLIGFESRTVEAVEALARWDHPQYGAISPEEFIGLADRAGLLPRVTQFVLEDAVRHLYLWQRSGLQCRAAINLSTAELQSPMIESVIRPTLDTWGIGLERLTLEVTETDRLGDVSPVQAEILRELTASGMHLSIDDFGTGYSNVGNLQALPWTELKVDRSFVSQIGTHPESDELVRAIIGLGHAFGRTVVAEGVETSEQWDRLIELDCDVAQGYLITPPLRPEALPEFVNSSPWNA